MFLFSGVSVEWFRNVGLITLLDRPLSDSRAMLS